MNPEKLTHAQIRQQKELLRQQISAAVRELQSAAQRVPDSVLNGSWQAAVAWRQKAEAAYFGRHATGGKRASLWRLRAVLAGLEKRAQELRGQTA